jgi:hypothetical protein
MSINWSTDQIRRSIPAKLLSQHVIDNGVLSIERRWVDSELPDTEVLDALAHIYGQLALLIVNLHDHLGVPIPELLCAKMAAYLQWNAHSKIGPSILQSKMARCSATAASSAARTRMRH